MNLGIPHFRHMAQRIIDTKKRFAEYKNRVGVKTAVTKVARTVEVGVGALAGGVMQGRAGEHGLTLFHVPAEILGGLALNVAGHFKVAGDASDHMINVGDGLIASYVNHLGFGIGRSWRDTGKLFGGHHALAETKASGALPPGMNSQQMAEMITRMQTAG